MPDGVPFIPQWSVKAHLDFMDRNGVKKSIMSCSTPGTFFVKDDLSLAIKLTRQVNEYAADLVKQYPDRFGFWASLPLPDIQSSLNEIDYAMDTLHADGVILLSNHHGVYLGDPILQPIMQKLNERKIKVFVHPTVPCNRHATESGSPASVTVQSAPLLDAYMAPMMEYIFDSTRTFIDIILSGTATQYPYISWIVTHAGVALPNLLDRVVRFSAYNLPTFPARQVHLTNTATLKKLLNEQFFFDLAGGTTMPNNVPALLRWVGPNRIVYGSDVPWTDIKGNDTVSLRSQLTEAFGHVTEFKKTLNLVFWGNAEMMLRKT
ncbi:MAG: hypothetical protein M1814_004160 [Vezdaea aestivalis]|nr:MAG: hypothetical protein M1814_004160 [Vezdaea aestivalis]